MKKTLLLPLCVTQVLILSACASKPEPAPEEHALFVTNIKPDGSKMFSFSVEMQADKKGGAGGGRGRPSGGGRGDGMGPPPDRSGGKDTGKSDEDKTEKVFQLLDMKLAETGYCREGYIEIDTYETEKRINILGECNESATDEDKRQFVNQYGY